MENFWHSTFYWTARGSIWLYLRVWLCLRTTGREHAPAVGGVIFAANHCSYLDPPVLGCAVPKRIVHFMARTTLQSNWLATFFFKHAQIIPIDRNKGDLAALKKTISALKQGAAVGIFPEGTRSKDGRLQSAKGGIGFLIAKGNVPVVPVYLSGTFRALPRGAGKIKRTRISAHFGKPILPEELLAVMPEKGDYQAVGDLVMQRIQALQDIHEQPSEQSAQ